MGSHAHPGVGAPASHVRGVGDRRGASVACAAAACRAQTGAFGASAAIEGAKRFRPFEAILVDRLVAGQRPTSLNAEGDEAVPSPTLTRGAMHARSSSCGGWDGQHAAEGLPFAVVATASHELRNEACVGIVEAPVGQFSHARAGWSRMRIVVVVALAVVVAAAGAGLVLVARWRSSYAPLDVSAAILEDGGTLTGEGIEMPAGMLGGTTVGPIAAASVPAIGSVVCGP